MTSIGKGHAMVLAARRRALREVSTHVETRSETVPEDIWQAVNLMAAIQEQLKAELADMRARLVGIEQSTEIVEDHNEAINTFVDIAAGLSAAIKDVKKESDQANEGIRHLLTIADNMQAEIKQAAGM